MIEPFEFLNIITIYDDIAELCWRQKWLQFLLLMLELIIFYRLYFVKLFFVYHRLPASTRSWMVIMCRILNGFQIDAPRPPSDWLRSRSSQHQCGNLLLADYYWYPIVGSFILILNVATKDFQKVLAPWIFCSCNELPVYIDYLIII